MQLDDFLKHQVSKHVDEVLERKAVEKAETPGVTIVEDRVQAILTPGEELSDLPGLLAKRGLDPADWDVLTARVNEWEVTMKLPTGPTKATNHQFAVTLAPSISKRLGIMAARSDGPDLRFKRPTGFSNGPKHDGAVELFAILPDQQIPHHDRPLHELVCRWLETNQPYGMILSGDTIDLPTVSKHRHNPHMVKDRDKALQNGIDTTYQVVRDYVQASASPFRKALPGNHEERFQNFIIEQAFALYGVKRADSIDDYSALSIPFLCRLDELGFDWVTAPNGAEWPDAELILSPHLAIRHGWLAAKGSGMTALKTLEHLGYSCIVGHTHRQSQVFKTIRQIDGTRRTLTGIEAGTLAEAHEGLGYSIAPDWQQGFAVVRMFEDGTFDASLAKYVNNTLIWEGQRYTDRGPKGIQVAA